MHKVLFYIVCKVCKLDAQRAPFQTMKCL